MSPDAVGRRIGVLGLWHETNTYSARPTGLEQFVEYEVLDGAAIVAAHRGVRSVVGGFLDGAGAEAVPLFSAGAWPGGPADAATLATLLARLETSLVAAGRLDGVLLNLHGAMVADGEPDVEALVVDLVRRHVGTVPIAAVLDLHGNPSIRLAESTDVLVGYDTYPHTDMWECGSLAASLLREAVEGRALRTAIAKVPLLTTPLAQGTSDSPMRELMAWAKARGEEAGALRVSLQAGFAYSDVERAGFSVLVVGDADRHDAARALAEDIAAVVARRIEDGAFEIRRPAAKAAVRDAIATVERPVVLADIADNVGGGSAGDGTVLLAELIAQEATGAVVVLADAVAARLATRLGAGAAFDAPVGGRTDDLHGDPVPIAGVVRTVTDGTYTSAGSWATGQQFSMGLTAVIDTGGVSVVLTERATPPFHVEHLTSLGIDPAAQRIIVAKGAVAWRAAFGDVARTVIEVDTPGACPIDPWSLPRSATPTGT